MSHPDDLCPQYFRRPHPDGLGEHASDLTDDLEMADDPALDQLICFEYLSAVSSVALDASDGFQGAAPADPSERHRLAKDTSTDARPEPLLGDDVDRTSQQGLQVHE